MFIDDSSATELISLEDVARHLRVLDPDEGVEIERIFKAARSQAERYAARTFRATVTRTVWYETWPQSPVSLPWPPVTSITSVDYYDENDADTNVTSGNYSLRNPDEDKGFLHWDSSFAFPPTATRPDAIRIQYVTGGSLPEDAKHAILLLCELNYGGDGMPLSHLRQKQLEDRAKDLLNSLTAHVYV